MKKGKQIKIRTYQEIEVSKKQAEWIKWYQLGENSWWNAFYQYKGRRRKGGDPIREKTWFNSVLKSIQKKGLFIGVTFAFISTHGIQWQHPGFANDGYRAEVLERDIPDYFLERTKII